MRHTINGRIVGHRLFTPDPKNNPGLELVKVEVDLAPLAEAPTDKNSRAVLIVPETHAQHFPLRGNIRVQVEDVQQVLPLARATGARRRDRQANENDEPR